MGSLPDFVPPMLAKLGVPFDSGEHLFEIKWDGIRALTFVEGGQHRMLTRSRNELTARYPELESLARLPEARCSTASSSRCATVGPTSAPSCRANTLATRGASRPWPATLR